VEDDLARERRFGSGPNHPEAVRGNAKSNRDDHRLLKRFAKMKDDKRLSSIDADIIIWGAMECADKVAEGEVDPEELLEGISVSGLPDSDSWEGYKGCTAGLVRAVLEQVGQATDEEPEELLEAAIRSAQWKAERSKLEAEKVERDLRTPPPCSLRRPRNIRREPWLSVSWSSLVSSLASLCSYTRQPQVPLPPLGPMTVGRPGF
jgi:hypothetical protein